MARNKKAIPQSVRRAVIKRDKGVCRYCGKPGKVHWYSETGWVWIEHELDHIIPEYLGGTNTIDNIVIACQRCNRTKGHRTNEIMGMSLLRVGD